MLRVVLDTNAITFEAPLSSNPEKLILDAAIKRQVQLVVPELVLAETMNLWRERSLAQRDKVQAQAQKLATFGLAVDVPAAEAVHKVADQVEVELRTALRSCCALIPDFPDVPHEHVVRRALDRKQPFDNQGKDGYRDVLLWHVVKEMAQAGDVVLVTNDKRAFASGEGDTLAKVLQDELTDTEHGVELVPSLRTLVERLAEQDKNALEQVEALLRQRSFRTLVDEALDDAVSDDLDLDAREIAALGFSVPIELAWLAGPEELGLVKAVKAYSRPGGEALVELDITLGARIRFQVPNMQVARALAESDDVWLDHLGASWETLSDAKPVHLATIRLVHLRADASIALHEGRLDRLTGIEARLAGPDEEFERPVLVDE